MANNTDKITVKMGLKLSQLVDLVIMMVMMMMIMMMMLLMMMMMLIMVMMMMMSLKVITSIVIIIMTRRRLAGSAANWRMTQSTFGRRRPKYSHSFLNLSMIQASDFS